MSRHIQRTREIVHGNAHARYLQSIADTSSRDYGYCTNQNPCYVCRDVAQFIYQECEELATLVRELTFSDDTGHSHKMSAAEWILYWRKQASVVCADHRILMNDALSCPICAVVGHWDAKCIEMAEDIEKLEEVEFYARALIKDMQESSDCEECEDDLCVGHLDSNRDHLNAVKGALFRLDRWRHRSQVRRERNEDESAGQEGVARSDGGCA